MEQALEAADDALLASDPWTGLAGYIQACIELRSGALASLAGQIETTDEMLRTAPRSMARMTEIVARAHTDGSLRAHVTALRTSCVMQQLNPRPPDSVPPREHAH